MKPSPCLHPIQVYNRSLGRVISVPCGHCEACIVSKGFNRSQRYSEVLSQYQYIFMLTLTYNNDWLPLATYDSELDAFVSDDADKDGVCRSVNVSDLTAKDISFIESNYPRFKGIPVLNHNDLRNFKQNLRYHLFRKLGVYEEIYIYAAGEYGPTTFRPHFHLLFGFNSQSVQSVLRECILKAWSYNVGTKKRPVYTSFGFIELHEVVGNREKAVGYCTQYLNSVTHLPNFLQQTVFRPFSTCSREVCRQYVECLSSKGDIFVSASPTFRFVSNINNKQSDIPLPSYLESRIFPRLPFFSQLSDYARIVFYESAARLQSLSAKDFADTIICKSDAGCSFDVSPLVYSYVKIFKPLLSTEEKERNFLIRLYYVSVRFLSIRDAVAFTSFDAVKTIERYYSNKELLHLKEFYELQNDLLNDWFHPCKVSDLFNLYYSTDNEMKLQFYYREQFGFDENRSYSIDALPLQASFRSMMCKILADTTKTKKHNDSMLQRGVRKKKFIPYPSKLCLRYFQI